MKYIEFIKDIPSTNEHERSDLVKKGSQWWIARLGSESHQVITESWGLWKKDQLATIDWAHRIHTIKGASKPWFVVDGITRAFKRLKCME